MTPSEKLQKIAENEQKVFTAGENVGYSEGYNAGYEEGSTQGFDEGHAQGSAEGWQQGLDEGVNIGKSQQYDEFWDVFQQNGNRKYYPYAFSFGWNDTNFSPKHPLANLSQVTYMFFNSEITDVNVDIDIHSIRADAMFSQCKQLQTIKKLIVDENTVFTSNSFYQCEALENIAIQGVIASDINIQDSPLSKNSITNIINALSTSTSGKTLTLSEAAVNTAFETTAGAGDGEASAAWISLEQSRSDWTISLA